MKPPSTLLSMPPEIRNMIWTQALVRPQIHVAWVACEYTLQKEHSHRTFYKFRYWSADIGGYTNGDGTYVGLQKQREEEILPRILTIQTGKEVDNDQPYLNTLLLCRGVSAEAAPIFYSQNCFVFGGPHETDEITGSTPLLPAHAFLKDRSTDTLSMIKRIELQFIGGFHSDRDGWVYTYPFANYGLPTDDFCQASIEQEKIEQGFFPFVKANMSLAYLKLSICGWSTTHKLPDETIFKSGINPVLAHLCDMNKVGRLEVKFTNGTYLLETSPLENASPNDCRERCHVHSGHGSQCFARDATENDDLLDTEDGDFFWNPRYFTWDRLSGCSIAHEALRAAAFVRLLRHHILDNGEKKGYQDIKVLMGGDTFFGQFIHVCTDDDKDGKSYLEEEQHQQVVSEYDIDPFASAGGSGILDKAQPRGWTPQWEVEEK